ncbi:hypothetical protein GQ457_02G023380 [Hibiscus cannabinus]
MISNNSTISVLLDCVGGFVLSGNRMDCRCCNWSPPPEGYVKFNTDGAVGVRNIDPTSIGLLDVLEACKLFSISSWFKFDRLILECDSKLAVEWMSSPHVAPDAFRPIILSSLKFCVGAFSFLLERVTLLQTN